MKIAIIVRRLDVKGGTQRQALALANELQRRGHEISVYTFTLDRERCYTELLGDIRVVTPPALDEIRAGRGSWGAYALFRRSSFFRENRAARALARVIDPDTEVLNPHDTVAYRVAAYYKSGVRDIPAVWSMNDLPAERWVLRRMVRFNPDFVPGFRARLAARIKDLLDYWLFIRRMDSIAVLDRFNQRLVRRYFGRSSAIVRSGLDHDQFPYRPRAPLSGKRVRLLAAGILFGHRRFEDAILAVRILADWGFDPSLTIIGATSADPAYFRRLERMAAEQGIGGRVHFAGAVSDDELVSAYQEHDVFIFPNEWQTWGLAIFEAMACGLPAVVSRGSGGHEVLTDLKDAVLVDPRDPMNIARAVREFLLNARLYLLLSANGAAFARDRISWQRYADGMLELFGEAARRQISPAPQS